MSKAKVGDLICWSAQSRWSPMKFGIVYRMNGNIPWVRTMGRVDRPGRKQEASTNYLVIASEYVPRDIADPKIEAAVNWWHSVENVI